MDEPSEEAMPALITALNDGEYRVYEKAVKALANIGTSEARAAIKNAR